MILFSVIFILFNIERKYYTLINSFKKLRNNWINNFQHVISRGCLDDFVFKLSILLIKLVILIKIGYNFYYMFSNIFELFLLLYAAISIFILTNWKHYFLKKFRKNVKITYIKYKNIYLKKIIVTTLFHMWNQVKKRVILNFKVLSLILQVYNTSFVIVINSRTRPLPHPKKTHLRGWGSFKILKTA